MKKLYAVLLCLTLLLCCGCGSASVPAPAEEPAPAETPVPAEEPAAPAEETAEAAAPDASGFRFSTTDREGNVWDESVFAQHELTMINFWEPWCGPCVGEMPDLQKLYETYGDRGLMILGVYATPGMEEDVDAALEQTGVRYPILHFCDEMQVFESGYVPTTVFVDREGQVLNRELDEQERDMLADVIQAMGEDTASRLYVGANSYEGWAAVVEGLLP